LWVINRTLSSGNFRFNLPFTQSVDCPTNYPDDWYLLRSKVVSPSSDSPNWVEVSVEIQPSIDINALVIGGPCDHNSSGILGVYFLDNLRLNDKSSFDFELLDTGSSPCDPDFVFAVANDSNSSYQWYKEGIAIIGETNSELSKMYGEGLYQLRITDQNTLECRIADDFEFTIPVYEQEEFKTICENETLLYNEEVIEEVGTYEFTLISANGCDSIVTLNVIRKPSLVDTVYAQILHGASYKIGNSYFKNEGEYIVNLLTKEGCDSTVVLHLKNINAFVPNIFSPNGDNNNDYFEVFTSGNDFLNTEISIYDRWGGLIYLGDRWDGTHNNKFVDPGVFIYFIKLIGLDGSEMNFSGEIAVIK